MKKLLSIVAGCLLVAGLYFAMKHTRGTWAGVDETVVEKYARQAGHPPRKPLINTDQGDLLLFCFLIAGTGGGFAAGYYFRDLFPPDREQQPEAKNLSVHGSANR
jgi:ABC-type cobalt transport system substrate-binding protein